MFDPRGSARGVNCDRRSHVRLPGSSCTCKVVKASPLSSPRCLAKAVGLVSTTSARLICRASCVVIAVWLLTTMYGSEATYL